MNAYTAAAIQNVALIILIALSIWWTESFWGLLLVFAMASVETTK